ncbi:MAG TPA: hypothetical protein VGR37_02755 [Longimicrobiaceae bacterium]|nr:hypothetical protein [Longimicrobiaceae bacterium]
MGRLDLRHPLRAPHAALVLLPALLLDTAFALDLVGRLLDAGGLWTAGGRVGTAGVVAGLVAGLPAGLTGARRRGGRTAAFALPYLAGVALFALARWVRGDAAIPPEPVLVGAEGMATLLVYAGGWAGGYFGGGAAPAGPRQGEQ